MLKNINKKVIEGYLVIIFEGLAPFIGVGFMLLMFWFASCEAEKHNNKFKAKNTNEVNK